MNNQHGNLGYISCDDLMGAAKAGRLAEAFEGSKLTLINGTFGATSIYGMSGAVLSRSGVTLPDELHAVLENRLSEVIAYRGLNSYSLDVHAERVHEHGSGLGNWVQVRNRGFRGVAIGIQVGVVTSLTWKGPAFELLGIDTEKRKCVYAYVGEILH